MNLICILRLYLHARLPADPNLQWYHRKGTRSKKLAVSWVSIRFLSNHYLKEHALHHEDMYCTVFDIPVVPLKSLGWRSSFLSVKRASTTGCLLSVSIAVVQQLLLILVRCWTRSDLLGIIFLYISTILPWIRYFPHYGQPGLNKCTSSMQIPPSINWEIAVGGVVAALGCRVPDHGHTLLQVFLGRVVLFSISRHDLFLGLSCATFPKKIPKQNAISWVCTIGMEKRRYSVSSMPPRQRQ